MKAVEHSAPVPELPGDTDRARLQGLPLIAALSAADAQRVLERARASRILPGQEIFAQNQPADGIYVILEGHVGLSTGEAGGQGGLIEVVSAVQVIGETGLFDSRCWTLSARAISQARVVWLPAVELLECLDRCPGLRMALLGFLSTRLRVLVRQIAQLKLMTTAQRLASFLAGLAGQGPGPARLVLDYERRVLAPILGMTPESLSRALHKLREAGIDSPNNREIHIADRIKLRAYAAGREGP